MRPQYDSYGYSANFLPEEWNAGAGAAALRVRAASTNVYPCAAANRRAMDPVTGQMLGPNSALAIGTLVPNTGSIDQRRVSGGHRVRCRKPSTTIRRIGVTPRVGAAWDVKGDQRFVVRGGAGLFYDRAPANTVYGTVNNPPFTRNVTVRYGELQNMSLDRPGDRSARRH